MIMKFDHIALACRRADLPVIFQKFSSYRQIFYEKNLQNILAKKSLLNDSDLPDHDVILLKHTNSDVEGGGYLPIEITAYDDVEGIAKYMVEGQTITAYTSNLFESVKFYNAMGFKSVTTNSFQIKFVMDTDSFSLKLIEQNENNRYTLDNCGFCCIALITNNALKDKAKLSLKNISTTKINQLIVNGKLLDIFFAFNQWGDIVEFIEVNKRKPDL